MPERFNLQHHLSGHLWQGRFFSCVLDDEHLWAAVRYVEQNPVRAGLVEKAEDYEGSSAAARCGLKTDGLLSSSFSPEGRIVNWREWLTGEEALQSQTIRRHTHTGRPCGSTSFVEDLEREFHRSLRPGKRGRKSRALKSTTGNLFNS